MNTMEIPIGYLAHYALQLTNKTLWIFDYFLCMLKPASQTLGNANQLEIISHNPLSVLGQPGEGCVAVYTFANGTEAHIFD